MELSKINVMGQYLQDYLRIFYAQYKYYVFVRMEIPREKNRRVTKLCGQVT